MLQVVLWREGRGVVLSRKGRLVLWCGCMRVETEREKQKQNKSNKTSLKQVKTIQAIASLLSLVAENVYDSNVFSVCDHSIHSY